MKIPNVAKPDRLANTSVENCHSVSSEARLNHARQKKRDAMLRRFGYDPAKAVGYVLSKTLPLQGHVLDIGTGKGRFAIALACHGAKVTTIDISASEQHFARLEADYAGVADRIHFIIRDAARMPWRTPRFAGIVSLNAFHHMEEPDLVFREMLKVLIPGGVLVLADLSASGFRIMHKIHLSEGRLHPHPPSHFAQWKIELQKLSFRVKSFRGCHQHILVAVAPSATTLIPKPKIIP